MTNKLEIRHCGKINAYTIFFVKMDLCEFGPNDGTKSILNAELYELKKISETGLY